jgi:AraC-like DNA-binding protein
LGVPSFTLPPQYLKQMADTVRSHGAEVTPWLERHGLSEASLDDHALTLSLETFRELLLDAMTVTREPAYGLFVGQRLQANVHGMLGYAVLSSASIQQAIDVVERFIQVRFSLVTIASEPRAGGIHVYIRDGQPLGEIRRPLVETVVMAIKNVLDTISMGACRFAFVELAFEKPDYAPLARELLGCDVKYGRPTSGFRLSKEALAVPLRMADPIAFRDAAAVLQRELDRIGSNGLSDRVRRLFFEHGNGFPSLKTTARILKTSPRTLHRRLIDEGTSFRELLDDVRRSLAIEYLRAERLSIEEIAFTLGYTDLANFRRAFRRWESIPPSEFRANARRERRR